jgi:hypothetical protein
MVFSLGHLVIFGLKILQFRTASGKIPITSAGLGLEQRFFLNESLDNKLYEYETIFEQLFSEKKLLSYHIHIYHCVAYFMLILNIYMSYWLGLVIQEIIRI